PRPFVERRCGPDRAEDGEVAFRSLGEAFWLRRADGCSPPGRVGWDRAAREGLLRLVARQPSDRTGFGGHAASDGGGVRGGCERGHADQATAPPDTCRPPAR